MLAGLLARPTSKPSPCPTLPHFDRLPLDSPASISTVRSYSSSFRTLVFFSTLVPLSYSAIRYPLDVSTNSGGLAARPRRPTLPHSWPTTSARPAPPILTTQLSPQNVIIHFNSYRLSREMLIMYLNPWRARTGGSIAQNTTFPAPFFSSWCDSKAFSRAFSHPSVLVFRFQSPYRAAVPTRARSRPPFVPCLAILGLLGYRASQPVLLCRLTSKQIKAQPRYFSLLFSSGSQLCRTQ